MKIKTTYIIVIFFIIFLLLFFLFINKEIRNKSITLSKADRNEKIKIGLILGYGGLGDKSFNDMQYNGLVRAKNLYNIDIIYHAPKDKSDIEAKIDDFVKKGIKYIIVGEGYEGKEIIEKFNLIYKNVHFILLDNMFDIYPQNVSSILFKQNEVSFLVGCLSALFSKNKKVAFFGATKLDVIEDFYIGFEQGVKYINPNFKINKIYFSDYIDEAKVWDSPKEAFDITNKLYSELKFDIVYAVAAGTNIGVFNSCKVNNIYAIGVDADQDYIIPGIILTSAMKRLDNAIVFIVDLIINNKLENKNYILGLKEGGVSLTEMKYTKDILGEKIINKLEDIKNKIINGEIKVKTIFNY